MSLGLLLYFDLWAYGVEESPKIIRLIDTATSTYYEYSDIKFEGQVPEPDKNASNRHDYDLRLPLPITLNEKTKLIFFNQAKYNFMDTFDPYNRAGLQELIVNLYREFGEYSLMLSSGMLKQGYKKHVLSYIFTQVFFDNLRVSSSPLFAKSVLFRVRNINGRHDYVIVLYMAANFRDNWQLNVSIPSEVSLSKDYSHALFKFGVRIDGLENLVNIEDSNYWLIGYRAYGFVRYAHALYDPLWGSFELGSALEEYKVYDNSAKHIGTRNALAKAYALMSLGLRFN